MDDDAAESGKIELSMPCLYMKYLRGADSTKGSEREERARRTRRRRAKRGQ